MSTIAVHARRQGFQVRCWRLAEYFSVGEVHWCRHHLPGGDYEFLLVRVERLDEDGGRVLVRQVDDTLLWWPVDDMACRGHLETSEAREREAFNRWRIECDVAWNRRSSWEWCWKRGGYAALGVHA